jgi:hypothetical protein
MCQVSLTLIYVVYEFNFNHNQFKNQLWDCRELQYKKG